MDIVTQLTLGASIAQISLGKKIGFKAAFYGAAIAALPDLDVLIPAQTDIDKIIAHRSWSHSLFILTLLTPILSWFIIYWRKDSPSLHVRWIITVWFCLITHALLDAFTVYGTHLLWPFVDVSVIWGSLFIIDPIYTLPLLIGVLISLKQKNKHKITRINVFALSFSTLYIFWSVLAQSFIENRVKDHFIKHNIPIDKILVSSSPFNTLLWRYVAIDNTHYYEGFYSFVDGDDDIQYKTYHHQKHLLNDFTENYYIKELKQFTHDLYKVEWKDHVYHPTTKTIAKNPSLIITDLRMGFSENYVFRFKIAEKHDHVVQFIENFQLKRQFSTKKFKKIFPRIFDSSIVF